MYVVYTVFVFLAKLVLEPRSKATNSGLHQKKFRHIIINEIPKTYLYCTYRYAISILAMGNLGVQVNRIQ